MFFNLEYISHHPCHKMQEVIEFFFKNLINTEDFGIHLFPEWFRQTINRSPSLREEFKNIFDKLPEKDQVFRQHIYEQLTNNNYIQRMCNETDFNIINHLDWDSDFGQELKRFFEEKLYESLDRAVFKPDGCTKKPKKSFYNAFIKKNKHVCPFCGIEQYPNPKGKSRSDLDHYLNKAKYPFSSANLKNLVPMCDRCNQDYKKEKNIIIDGKNRVLAFYPYDDFQAVHLVISCEIEPSNIGDTGSWHVSLNSDDQTVVSKISTWDRVFEIKDRIREEVEEFYEDWMDEFYDDEFKEELDNLDEFKNLLDLYSENLTSRVERRNEVKAIIKKDFFRCMAHDVSDIFLNRYLISFNNQLKQIV